MNIKFEKDGLKKETHEQFKDLLLKEGWKVVGDDDVEIKEEAPKKRGRKPKGE